MALRPLLMMIKSLWLWFRPIRLTIGNLWIVWAIWALWGVLIYAAAYHEGVLYLPAPGRGLLEHYSFWASFLVGPVLLTAAYHARSRFLQFAVDAVEQYATDEGKAIIRNEVRPLAERWQRTLASYLPLIPLAILGANFSISAYRKLDRPIIFWGNDVFNAHAYPLSSIAANGYLWVLWSIIYPLVAVYMMQTAGSVQRVVSLAMRRNVLHLDLLHPDGCAGLARFGNLNLRLIFLYFLPAVPIVMLYVTHERLYFSAVDIAIGLLILVSLQSFFGLWPIARLIRATRDREINSWNDKVRHLVTLSRLGSTQALVALRYRDCLVAVRSFPYEKSAVLIVGILQLALGLLVILGVTESSSAQP